MRRVQITAFSFAENLSDNKPSSIPVSTVNAFPAAAVQQLINARGDIRIWNNANNNNTQGAAYWANFQAWHSLSGTDGEIAINGTMLPSPDLWYRVNDATAISSTGQGSTDVIPVGGAGCSPLMLGYNLPYLTAGQAYIRKMRIPGWNPSCKGEIYLLWAPVLTAYQSGDIVEVGSKSYAVITEGAVCWAARVS